MDESKKETAPDDVLSQYPTGSVEWFLARDGGTPEQQALKRKAWEYMEYGAYDDALKILWKHFPEEYPIPECEREIYAPKVNDADPALDEVSQP